MLPKSPLTSVSFNATWVKNWEPFYISRRNVPMFDERFKQYGFDRQEQICELRVAGYTFSVLNNHFLVHDVSTPIFTRKRPFPVGVEETIDESYLGMERGSCKCTINGNL